MHETMGVELLSQKLVFSAMLIDPLDREFFPLPRPAVGLLSLVVPAASPPFPRSFAVSISSAD